MPWAIDKRDVAFQFPTHPVLVRVLVGFLASLGRVTTGFALFGVGSFIYFGIGVTQFDGDVPFQFVFETNGLNTTDGFDHGGFTVRHVPNGTDVDGGLS